MSICSDVKARGQRHGACSLLPLVDMQPRDAEEQIRDVHETYVDQVRTAANSGASETLIDDHRIQALTRLSDVEAAVADQDREAVDELVDSTRDAVIHETW
jgi:hypothetical protein